MGERDWRNISEERHRAKLDEKAGQNISKQDTKQRANEVRRVLRSMGIWHYHCVGGNFSKTQLLRKMEDSTLEEMYPYLSVLEEARNSGVFNKFKAEYHGSMFDSGISHIICGINKHGEKITIASV
jgi:hypothetical protein